MCLIIVDGHNPCTKYINMKILQMKKLQHENFPIYSNDYLPASTTCSVFLYDAEHSILNPSSIE